MAKTLTITWHGEQYILEYTRRSVKEMESSGFVASDVKNKPLTGLLDLFCGAFIANHAKVVRQKREQIYDSLSNKDKLMERLTEMYNEPLATLMEDPDGDEGNATWTASW